MRRAASVAAAGTLALAAAGCGRDGTVESVRREGSPG